VNKKVLKGTFIMSKQQIINRLFMAWNELPEGYCGIFCLGNLIDRSIRFSESKELYQCSDEDLVSAVEAYVKYIIASKAHFYSIGS
jgi:hypothetical protein